MINRVTLFGARENMNTGELFPLLYGLLRCLLSRENLNSEFSA